MRAAHGDNDIVGVHSVRICNRLAELRIACDRRVAERHFTQARLARHIQQFVKSKIRPDAFTKIVARCLPNQGDNVVLGKSHHVHKYLPLKMKRDEYAPADFDECHVNASLELAASWLLTLLVPFLLINIYESFSYRDIKTSLPLYPSMASVF